MKDRFSSFLTIPNAFLIPLEAGRGYAADNSFRDSRVFRQLREKHPDPSIIWNSKIHHRQSQIRNPQSKFRNTIALFGRTRSWILDRWLMIEKCILTLSIDDCPSIDDWWLTIADSAYCLLLTAYCLLSTVNCQLDTGYWQRSIKRA